MSQSTLPNREESPQLSPGWRKGAKRASSRKSSKTSNSKHEFTDSSRGERLHKVLAAAGIASRRACEELIREGEVRVNGHLVDSLPAWVNPREDSITVRGKKIRLSLGSICLMLYKPRGYECTASSESVYPSVLNLVADHPANTRLFPIGRLDVDSSGLLLLTNDGELSQRLTHPRYGIHKTYHVTVRGMLDDAAVGKLERGIFLAKKAGPSRRTRKPPQTSTGGKTAQSHIKLIKKLRDRTLLEMTLREGRNRQIRRMLADQGFPVKKLRRVRIGPLKLTGLRPGQWRELEPKELIGLRNAAGLE